MISYLSLAVVFACLSGFTYGYDICVISAVLADIESDMFVVDSMAKLMAEMIVAAMSLGMLLSRMVGWKAADILGRIKSLVIADVFITISVLLTIWSEDFFLLLACRLILGFGIGLALLVGPTYLSEIAPKQYRGRLITLHELCVCIGSAAGLGSRFVLPSASWRLLVGLSAVPSVVQLILTVLLPESPRWLALRGRHQEATAASKKLGIEDNGKSPEILPQGLRSLLKSHWKSLAISSTICNAGSACGFYAIQAFAVRAIPTFLPSLSEGEVIKFILPAFGVSKLVGVVFCLFLIDLIGRRAVLLASLLLLCMSHSMVLISWQFEDAGWFCVVGMGGAIFGWSLGLGSMTLLVSNEMLPTEYRALASSICLSLNSVTELIYHLTFPTMFALSPTLPFALFFAYCAFAVVVTFRHVPETIGKSLDHH